MARLKFILAYKGTRFAGWQIQALSGPNAVRTVQGVFEREIAAVLGAGKHPFPPVRAHGAGRTDSGVHALGQCAHVDIPDQRMNLDWQTALNARLPRDVAVVSVQPAPSGFHARFSAKEKIYAYSLWLSRRYILPQRRHYVWGVGPLDLEAMDRAARHFLGEHDFESFRNQGGSTKTSVRRILSIERDPAGPDPDSLELTLRFRANGFLKQMVRNLVGCLVEVGRGKIDPDAVPTILAARDRPAAPATAPPQGLTLERVVY